MANKESQLEISDILLRDKTDGNPFAAGPEGGALENFFIDQGKLVRASFMPPFHTSASSDGVWAIKEFNFTRDNATEQQLLIFKKNGRVYRRRGGEEVQVYPEADVLSASSVSGSSYAGTGGTTAGNGTDWANTGNITGGSNAIYASAANYASESHDPGGGGIVDSGNGGSLLTWSNEGNITASDDTYATCTVSSGIDTTTRNYLFAGGFNSFAIPSDATIVGVKVSIERHRDFQGLSDGTVKDYDVHLNFGSSFQGDNKADTSTNWPSSDLVATYGGIGDTWGISLTPADFNTTDNFGIGLGVSIVCDTNGEDPLATTAYVDLISATVYYTLASTDRLNATNYTFSPSIAGAVSGITVKVTGTILVTSGSPNSTMTVQLIKAGSLAGSTISQAFNSASSDITLIFGGSTNLWGASWISSDFSVSTFGASITCSHSNGTDIITFEIDSVQIIVTAASSATVTQSLFTRKPAIMQLKNRLHVSDGRIDRIYDGWNWVKAGLDAPTLFDSTDTSLTGTGLTGTYSIAITSVHIRSNNGVDQRVHESNRSALASETPANQSIRVSIAAVTLDTRGTHWSVYMSEISGSPNYRRVATLPITTTTYDIAAEPSATSPIAPERNDPRQPSRILTQWKNRGAARSETNPDQLWFLAFGEVDGLNNGAGEECMPGRLGLGTTLTTLANEWQIPDGGQPMQCAVYHGEVLVVFTDRNGFYIQGEGALLDNTGLRDFLPQKAASFGAAGPAASLSTPFGLAVVSHEHKLWLLKQLGGEPIDIGHDIQSRLDELTEQQLSDIEMVYWSGEGWDWLLIPLADRIGIFDFNLGTEKSPAGSWFSLGSQGALPVPTALAIYHPNKKFLLVGCEDGSVHQLATLCQPAHLGLSFKLGETYLGSTVQDSPTCIARTGPLGSGNGNWTEFSRMQVYHRGHTDQTSISTSDPIVKAYYDPTNPADPETGVTLTTATVSGSNEHRAWFAPSATASAAGALARNAHLQIGWESTDTDGQSRPQLVNNEVLRLSIASRSKGIKVR